MSLVEPAPPAEAALEAGGHAKGVAVAVVKENKDSSGLGRVKVSYPWHSQPTQSYWARVVTPMAGKDRGIYFIPEVEDEVLVAFERGDLRFPYIVGSLWNGKDKAPVTNSDGKNDIRLFKTRKGHKLTFNDNDGSQGLVQLELNDGKKLSFDDNGIKVDDGKGNSIVINSNGGSITIQAKTDLKIQAPKIAIEASGTLDVKSGGTLTLRGSLVNIN